MFQGEAFPEKERLDLALAGFQWVKFGEAGKAVLVGRRQCQKLLILSQYSLAPELQFENRVLPLSLSIFFLPSSVILRQTNYKCDMSLWGNIFATTNHK